MKHESDGIIIIEFSMKLSIIIPVYNEERTVDELLKRVHNARLAGWTKEIIVINDGSSDGTRGLLKHWEK